jgi:hypothetical protein
VKFAAFVARGPSIAQKKSGGFVSRDASWRWRLLAGRAVGLGLRPSTGEYIEAVASFSGRVIASIEASAYGASFASRFAPSTPRCVLLRKGSDALIALLLG